MKFNIVKKSPVTNSFKVNQIRSSFDVQAKEIIQNYSGDLPIENTDWNIGLIIGSSGSGKTTIANQVFGSHFFIPNWNKETVIDQFEESFDASVSILSSVGFCTPVNWIKPYGVLSNGEKMRADLALALSQKNEITIFDEFTSVVDREVAQNISISVGKTVRKLKKKFIAISCHRDITEYLNPDWVYDTDKQEFFFTLKMELNSITKFKLATEKSGVILNASTIYLRNFA